MAQTTVPAPARAELRGLGVQFTTQQRLPPEWHGLTLPTITPFEAVLLSAPTWRNTRATSIRAILADPATQSRP